MDLDHSLALEEITTERLLEICRLRFQEAEVDEDGDVRVLARHPLFIARNPDLPLVQFAAYFPWKPDANPVDRWELAHLINEQLALIRACAHDSVLMLDHYQVVSAGVTPRQVHAALSTFDEVVQIAVTRDHRDVLS